MSTPPTPTRDSSSGWLQGLALDRPHWRRPRRLLDYALILLGLAGMLLLSPPAAGLTLAVLGALDLLFWLYIVSTMIDGRIRALLPDPRRWPAHVKTFPIYKHVDIHRAAQRYARQHAVYEEIATRHDNRTHAILYGYGSYSDRRINSASHIARKVGPSEEVFIPTECFWIIPPQPGGSDGPCLIRIHLIGRAFQIEVVAPHFKQAEQVLATLLDMAVQQSIYRCKVLRAVFDGETSGRFSDEEIDSGLDLIFYPELPVGDAAIVLEDEQRGVIERTIIDFHRRRSDLVGLGLPAKRGVLFYGPPGTGKTYTCKYIAGRLDGVTTLVVTGHALVHMKTVCALARTFQPALVLLEDVDLVFANRELNAFNTVLGEFIDQLDGFGETDQVIFILTTNAIERVEGAIKDRPGRVSQCIYFGPPSAPLRQRYLQTLLAPYDTPGLDMERLVAQTEGVSQAFLKELVFRAVQLSGAAPNGSGRLSLGGQHFAQALHDMTEGSGRSAQRIIGFRVNSEH